LEGEDETCTLLFVIVVIIVVDDDDDDDCVGESCVCSIFV
jgi:hypothetical protein